MATIIAAAAPQTLSSFAILPRKILHRMQLSSTGHSCRLSSCCSKASLSNNFVQTAAGGQAELLLAKPSLESYFHSSTNTVQQQEKCPLLALAITCRHQFLESGMAHIPNFISRSVCYQMVQEATQLLQQRNAFYSTEDHTVYQEPFDEQFAKNHPRNARQKSSKWIIDYNRMEQSSSPLVQLYTSPHVQAFISYIVRPPPDDHGSFCSKSTTMEDFVLYESGCQYNAAYYNIYEPGDGLGWHFDRSEFGINLELQPAVQGGDFELCWNTRSNTRNEKDDDDDAWAFDKVQTILKESSISECSLAQRIDKPPVGPGSLVIFSGSRNLHRVTPVNATSTPRINAIMTYETQPNQKPNAYSLSKFFGR